MRVLTTDDLYHRTDPKCKDTGVTGVIAEKYGEVKAKSTAEKEGYQPCNVCFPEEANE